MFYIGVDLGGTGIKAGVVDEKGAILAKASCPTGVERGYGPVIADMAKLCLEALEKSGHTLDEVKANSNIPAMRRNEGIRKAADWVIEHSTIEEK